ncbi:chemotaxis protein CheA [Geomonas subterranea]|uniref:Chemotaxis protein CheA n=1 Tax=Geomonas subterranea TaxID=2847989 RepID=A0ABX8LGB4_9BACT|nr:MULTISPECIES: chemotaxis protein CheA [Geomonas]QXE89273.1 chemotaxis protein CheA [Geomonas subterranea]QXM08615.1 chemotaxis protein CheA [Geomonas subterranea]
MSVEDSIGKALKDFLAEAEEILDQLSLDLVSLSDCADGGECNPDLVNSVFRGAHSLKGLAGMFGLSDIAELGHHLENLLDALRLGKVELDQAVVSTLFESTELLAQLVRSAGETGGEGADLSGAMQRINDCLTRGPKANQDSPLARLNIPERVLSSMTEYEEHRLLENVKKGRHIHSIRVSLLLASFDSDLMELTDALKQAGEVISTLPSASSGLDAGIDFEILFGSELSAGALTPIIDRENLSITTFGEPAQERKTGGGAEAATVAEPAGAEGEFQAPMGGDGGSISAKSMSRTVRVDIGKLDLLMNIVGELVLSHSMIADVAARMRRDGLIVPSQDLNKAAKGLEKKLSELQKGVMEIRMIPVGQLFDKMTRIIRKIAREQGKKVELKLYGADTELDKLIIEDISDPVMHIVRNCIDHGIEPPEKRLAAGKDEKGTITLSSYQKGNHVVIQIDDDGGGIDLARVKQKAVKLGIIASPDDVSDREALDFIFRPGFSTTETVSEISGRGVGMDVVRTNIAALSGLIDVENFPGQGARFIITLPITLAIIKALIISTAGRTYALPITSVLESIIVEQKEIKTVERKEVIQLRESTLPLLRLSELFELKGAAAPESCYVVVVGVAEKRLGLVVDDLLGQQDIVIKSIGDTFAGFRGISGAADLGDQRTILVLDVGSVIAEATRGSA